MSMAKMISKVSKTCSRDEEGKDVDIFSFLWGSSRGNLLRR